MQDILEIAFDRLDRAYAQYRPSVAYAMFSGGYDSLVTLKIARLWSAARGVPLRAAHVNTTTGIEETRLFVHATTSRIIDAPLEEYCAADSYEQWIEKGGFPGPAQHSMMYNRLKQRSIAQLLRANKRHRLDKIMLIAGARQQESTRRMSTTQEIRQDESYGSAVWVNAIWHLSKDAVLDLKDRYRLPSNPVVDLLHMSGECGCGCYATPGEREERMYWFPKWGGWARDLEQKAASRGWCWRWGETPPAWAKQVNAGQQWMDGFSPMCSSCALRQESAEAYARAERGE